MDGRNFTFMFYGFAAAWVVLAGYLTTLVARQRKIRRQLETLKKLVEEREES